MGNDQGKRQAAEYTLEFCTLAVRSGWNDPVFKAVFCHGLNSEVVTELACRDDQVSLDSLIGLIYDNLLQNHN